MGIRNRKKEELGRLNCKTLEARFLHTVGQGLGCSPFEAQAVLAPSGALLRQLQRLGTLTADAAAGSGPAATSFLCWGSTRTFMPSSVLAPSR